MKKRSMKDCEFLINIDKSIWENKLSSLERELSTLGLEKNIIKRR